MPGIFPEDFKADRDDWNFALAHDHAPCAGLPACQVCAAAPVIPMQICVGCGGWIIADRRVCLCGEMVVPVVDVNRKEAA